MTEDYKTDDVFWDQIRKADIYREMAETILTSTNDLNDQRFARALHMMEKAHDLHTASWLHFFELNNLEDTPKNKFIASHASKKVMKG